jgi:hypothetical protein
VLLKLDSIVTGATDPIILYTYSAEPGEGPISSHNFRIVAAGARDSDFSHIHPKGSGKDILHRI